MKPTFLDYLAEVTASDYVNLGQHIRSYGEDPATHDGEREQGDSNLSQDLIHWLTANGYHLVDKHKAKDQSVTHRELATGARASVYIKNDNDPYVLKVARDPDPCWLNFIKMCRRINNPHVPKVSSLREWPGTDPDYPDDRYFLAMIERLHPLPLLTTKDFKEEHIPILLGIHKHITRHWKGTIHSILDDYGLDLSADEIREKGDEFLESNHPFAQVYQMAAEMDCWLDLHEYNVMMRLPDHTLVITDPVG
jgi:hypothetical protein